MQIQILLYDGFDELDAIGPLDVLQAASAAGLRVETVRLGSGTVTSRHGLQLHVPGRLDPEEPPELLVVPGAGWLIPAVPDPWTDAERRRIGGRVAELHRAGVVVAAVGGGGLLLAAAGVLRGRPAAARARWERELQDAGARPVRARVVDDGDVVTSAGLTAGIDLALWLVERFAGPAAAHGAEQALDYERRGTVWRRSSG
jgi:transcriptional regulator GlxA family with amidase domain